MSDRLFQVLTSDQRNEFRDIHRRMAATIRQLDEDDLHWRPNDQSNSIANLVLHIRGNIGQFIESGLGGKSYQRDRDYEFNSRDRFSKEQLLAMLDEGFQALDQIIAGLSAEQLLQPATRLNWRDGRATFLEVLNHCLTHYGEHLGQMIYIAKQRLGPEYAYLSIPPQGGRKAEL